MCYPMGMSSLGGIIYIMQTYKKCPCSVKFWIDRLSAGIMELLGRKSIFFHFQLSGFFYTVTNVMGQCTL